MSTNLIIALIAICLFFSALLSGSETAITYVPREKIHQLSDSKRNNKIKKAKDDLEQTIGGILVANNFVNILMASLSTILFVNFLDGDEKQILFWNTIGSRYSEDFGRQEKLH